MVEEQDMKDYSGYKPNSVAIMKKFGVKLWYKIEILSSKGTVQGVVLPRNKFAPDGFVEIKLKNGYNIGVPLDKNTKIKVIGEVPPMKVSFDQHIQPKNKNLPTVCLLGTGGTIASRLDYTTGAVIPAFEPGELFTAVPELAKISNIETEVVYQLLSENLTPQNWLELAKKIVELAKTNIDGIVIAHGTDTLSYASAALSFLLKNVSIPIVLVGSQRSSDRPSSDAALNLIHAVTIASKANIGEVVVCMMGSSAHDYGFIHRGTRVRKMHSSARHTFRSIGITPLGMIRDDEIKYFSTEIKPRDSKNRKKMECWSSIEEKVALIYSYPGMKGDILDFYLNSGYKGIVFAGSGLGHLPKTMYPALKRAYDAKIPILMTVQTLWGYTGMDVYESGRELQDLGVIPGKNMLPEVAFTKMCWALGNFNEYEKIREVLTTNIAGEITSGESMNGFQIFQGVEHTISPKE
ncbi:MAG: Glu-tRNA(Gln) amidotransferase subunit GatD [Candidatus Lokiarchaeota archaeon]|nr:Glu-tRNA(Gln) amidotransferase subunit GatD [Candidatus Harpocratesius repetitus]